MKKIDMQQMRQEGFLVLDHPARKLAVFPNTSGMVAVISEEDGIQSVTVITCDEISAVCKALMDAGNRAQEIDDVLTSSYETNQAIQRAMS